MSLLLFGVFDDTTPSFGLYCKTYGHYNVPFLPLHKEDFSYANNQGN